MLALPTPFNPSPSPRFFLSRPFSVLFAISVSRKASAKSVTGLSPSQFARTVNSPSSKSHRITSLAHPLHLTLIESHSYKNRGRGGSHATSKIPPIHFPFFPQRVNIAHTETPITPFHFIRLLHDSLVTGGTPLPSSATTLCVTSATSAPLRYPFALFQA